MREDRNPIEYFVEAVGWALALMLAVLMMLSCKSTKKAVTESAETVTEVVRHDSEQTIKQTENAVRGTAIKADTIVIWFTDTAVEGVTESGGRVIRLKAYGVEIGDSARMSRVTETNERRAEQTERDERAETATVTDERSVAVSEPMRLDVVIYIVAGAVIIGGIIYMIYRIRKG